MSEVVTILNRSWLKACDCSTWPRSGSSGCSAWPCSGWWGCDRLWWISSVWFLNLVVIVAIYDLRRNGNLKERSFNILVFNWPRITLTTNGSSSSRSLLSASLLVLLCLSTQVMQQLNKFVHFSLLSGQPGCLSIGYIQVWQDNVCCKDISCTQEAFETWFLII